MLKPIKLATINSIDYYYHPTNQSLNNLSFLQKQFLKTDLTWFSSLDLNKIVFYDKIFKNWWNLMLNLKKANYLYRAKSNYHQGQISHELSKKVFCQYGFNHNLIIESISYEQLKTNVNKNPSNIEVSIQAINRDLFATYYDYQINDIEMIKIVNPRFKTQQIIKTKINQALNAIKAQGLIPIIIFLQGAHNYGLDDEQSDYDFKALVASANPFDELVFKKAPTIVYNENNEIVDCKTWSDFKALLSKFSYNYLEILKSQAIYINNHFQTFYEKLINTINQNLNDNRYLIKYSIIDQTLNKIDALDRPFASKIKIIEKFGYDPKQLHHYFRLKKVFDLINQNSPFTINRLWARYDKVQTDWLINIKRHGYPPLNGLPKHLISHYKANLRHEFEINYVQPWKQAPDYANKNKLITQMHNYLSQWDDLFKQSYQNLFTYKHKKIRSFKQNKSNNW